jgi:hypothetical protein
MLNSKIDHLFTPLRARCDRLDMAMLLSDSSHFTNGKKGATQQESQRTYAEYFDHVVRTSPRFPPYEENPTYTRAMKAAKGSETGVIVEYHWRQYYTIAACTGAMSDRTYDMAVRIREDLVLGQPLDVDAVFAEIRTAPLPSVVSPIFDSWGGMNDKFAVMRGSDATAYFEATLRYWNYTHTTKTISSRAVNAETFHYTALEHAGLKSLPMALSIGTPRRPPQLWPNRPGNYVKGWPNVQELLTAGVSPTEISARIHVSLAKSRNKRNNQVVTTQTILAACPVEAFRKSALHVASLLPGALSKLGGIEKAVKLYQIRHDRALSRLRKDGRYNCKPTWFPLSTRNNSSSALLDGPRRPGLTINLGAGTTGTRFVDCVLSQSSDLKCGHNIKGLKGGWTNEVGRVADEYDYVSDSPVPYRTSQSRCCFHTRAA